ncbi:MAG: (Fe-S) protein, partial [Thiobacillus sp.]|nr:(Fe-S) protein [Thiobacillus sp.]
AARMLPEDAAGLLADPDWLVRLEAAGRAPTETLSALADDPESDVRAVALARLNGTPEREDAS